MVTKSGHTEAIPASKVIGSGVYGTSGEKIGSIEDVMLHKTSNNIMFAIVGFGGFLGLGEKYHALPWSVLNYEKQVGGYVVPFSKEQLQAAPAHSISELSREDGAEARDAAFAYYKADPYWP